MGYRKKMKKCLRKAKEVAKTGVGVAKEVAPVVVAVANAIGSSSDKEGK